VKRPSWRREQQTELIARMGLARGSRLPRQSLGHRVDEVSAEMVAYLGLHGGASPASWTPALPLPVSGQRTVLDWNPAVGVTGSGNSWRIADQSGQGNTGQGATNLSGQNPPSLRSSDVAFGGKPSLLFTGSPVGLVTASQAFSGLSTAFTIFLAWYDTATPGFDPGGSLLGITGLPPSTLTPVEWETLASATAGGNTDALVRGASAQISSFNIGSDWAITGAGAIYVHQADATNASHIVRLNGVQQARGSTISPTDPGLDTAGVQTFGVACIPANSANRTGRMGRCLAFNAALPLADIQTVESYLARTYGLP
jgi:hypothetical protein